jgi:membrane protein implicated in regulation of membrane protease activity
MTAATLWWVAAGLLVAAELATGTFYLLMIALGAAAGALAAHAGAAAPAQMAAAAVVGGVATAALHLQRGRRPASAPASANRDVNLDIGERVTVAAWAPDGSARVTYRGASWVARYAGPDVPQPGEHFIVALEGNQLVLAPEQNKELR